MPAFAPRRFAFFCLTSIASLAHAQSAAVALSPPDLSSDVRQISQTGNGELCIVGSVMDPDGDLQSRGTVAIFSPAKDKILWQHTVEAPDGNANIRMVACRSDGKFIYVAANVDTHTESSLNQGLAYVYKFDSLGKTVGFKELVTDATDAFIYDLDVDGSGVNVVGMTSDGDDKTRANGLYFARLDGELKTSNLNKLATGAYRNGSMVKLAKNVALFGGNFQAAKTSDGPDEDYAVSKIVAGKYQFSARPQKAKPDQVATAITAAGEIVSLGYAGKASLLTTVNAQGKVTQAVPVESALCEPLSLSADADTVFAVRKNCTGSDSSATLVAIDRHSGVETAEAGIAGQPLEVFALEAQAWVVSEKANNSLLLQSIDIGKPADSATDASTIGLGFTGTVNLAKTEGGAKRTLALSNWSVDKRGVPSFDYRYSQSGPECAYERSGHAIAGFDDNGGEIELQVYSGEDEQGKEGPELTMFYDHDDEVVFSMAAPTKPGHIWVSFQDAAMKKKFAQRCGFTTEQSGAIFSN